MQIYRTISLIFLLVSIHGFSQTPADSVYSAADSSFKINRGRSFFVGSNYRKEWKTPVLVPVIDLSKEKGGLTPFKVGGGKQTRTLRVRAADGKTYSIRTIEKFITQQTIPIDLQSEALVDLVADGISASYPYAALSMPVFANAAGVPWLDVKLAYIGDDPQLGEFRKDFSNRLVYLEEREPRDVDKGYDTDEVAEKLQKDHDNSIDQRAMLRARILDMYVMDFDRHENQWVWVAVEKEKGKEYYPVPKDRDQVFYINQGLFPGIASWPWLAPQLEGLKVKARNIKRFNFSNRNFDRFFLNELNERDWRIAVEEFLPKMTDSVIETALAKQPPEIRHISTDKIICTLKERRKYLMDDLIEYHRFLSEIVTVTASDDNELFEVTPYRNDSLRVQVFQLKKRDEQGAKIYDRTFDARYTDEVRLFGFGGDDRFLVKGANERIKVRMIGGDGEDIFQNTAPENGGVVYDLKSGKNKLTGSFTNRMSNDTAVNSYDRLYYKYNQLIPFISGGFNLDDGLFLGGSLRIIRHGFRKSPYKSSHSIQLTHALGTSALNFRYNSEFIGFFGKKSDLLLQTDLRAPEVINFFGYGANTVYDESQPGKFRFYRARYTLGDISVLLRKNFTDKLVLSFGPALQFFRLDSLDRFNKERYIVNTAANGLDPATLFNSQTYAGGRVLFTADTRDHRAMPSKGIFWQTSLVHLYGLQGTAYKTTRLNSDFSFQFSFFKKLLVVANRVGAGHNFGNFEFYQAQFLGNEDNLRGYRKTRFAGHSKVYNNLELRLTLSNFYTYLFPGSLGILGFYDTGRIWAKENNSDEWLSGYGVGLWFSPLRRIVITASYAISKEDKLPIAGIGWKF